MDLHLQDFDEQRVCEGGGGKNTSFFKYKSNANSSPKQCRQTRGLRENWDSSGK